MFQFAKQAVDGAVSYGLEALASVATQRISKENVSGIVERAPYVLPHVGRKNSQGNAAMSTTCGVTEVGWTDASTPPVSSFFKRCWDVFQGWRKRQRERADLYRLNERELMDIGMTRGEIECIGSSHSISFDPLRWMSDIAPNTGTKLPPRVVCNPVATRGEPDIVRGTGFGTD